MNYDAKQRMLAYFMVIAGVAIVVATVIKLKTVPMYPVSGFLVGIMTGLCSLLDDRIPRWLSTVLGAGILFFGSVYMADICGLPTGSGKGFIYTLQFFGAAMVSGPLVQLLIFRKKSEVGKSE